MGAVCGVTDVWSVTVGGHFGVSWPWYSVVTVEELYMLAWLLMVGTCSWKPGGGYVGTRLASSNHISSRISPNTPWLAHCDWSRQLGLFRGIPFPQSLSEVHSTIFLRPVLCRSVDLNSTFCLNLALIPG